MALSYLFDPNKQFQDKNGVNNVGGYLYVFINDSDDHAPTYCNFTGTLNPERIVLDNNGRAVVIVDELKTYRIEVYDRSGNLLWSQYPVRPTNVIYGDYNVYNADINGTPDEIDVDVETSASGVKKFTIKLANAVKTVIGNIQDTISSIVESVSTKADKVSGATSGNLASLDANGNLTDSGKKASDFKTKQTAVTDPTADGTGLSFIDSVTQNANGEIAPHKKTVPDGTTGQKGVVQLQDSIGSTESATDRAVTPHAVRAAIDSAVSSAYHAAGTKTVAQLTSSLLVAENEGCVYNITDSGTTTPDFVDGAGHPINAGDNVVVCDVGGGVYKFDLLSGFVDLSNYLTKTGNASDITSTFTKASVDTSSMTSGSALSAILTAISSFFASLKVLAFKDSVGTSDIDDDAITAAKVKDNETLPVNVSGTAGMADKLRYQDGNTIDFANVPITGNKHRSWFNYNDGDTNQSNPSNPVKSYWFGDRNGKTENTKLVTGGITNKTFIGSSSSVTWNSSVGTGYGCCCIKFTYDLTTGKTRTVVIRLLIDCNKSDGDMCYVDLMLKVQPNDWNTFAITTGRFDTSTNSNLGRIYYRRVTNVYYFAVETGAISSKVTPIIIGSDDESDSDYSTLNVEFGNFNSELVSSDWIQQSTKRVVYKDMGGTPIGNSSTPIYVDTDGSVKECGFQVNFGNPLSGANVLNIVTA